MNRVFFTDRDLGKAFPQALRDAGLKVESHSDHFPPATSDPQWLEEVGRRGWIALTHDKRIRYKRNERDAVMAHGVSLFVLVGAAPLPHLARNFIATQTAIAGFLEAHSPPFIAKVFRPGGAEHVDLGRRAGRVEMWLSHAEWSRAGKSDG